VLNSQLLPREWLDENRRVITPDAYFRVRGNGTGDSHADGVYALGNIFARSNITVRELDDMVPVVCLSIRR